MTLFYFRVHKSKISQDRLISKYDETAKDFGSTFSPNSTTRKTGILYFIEIGLVSPMQKSGENTMNSTAK